MFKGKCERSVIFLNEQENLQENLMPLDDSMLSSALEGASVMYSALPYGLRHLVGGYVEYAKLVVLDRAIPRIDGLKISQRRALYALHNLKGDNGGKVGIGTKIKSFKLATATLDYHPHNPDSIYETFSKFVDDTKYTNVPILKAESEFGHRNMMNSTPAARYTHISKRPVIEEFFKELDGVEFGLTEDDSLLEPKLLPVSFPFGLTYATVGIGVGTGSSNFSYTLGDIVDATVDIIETGTTERILVPDFPTGGKIQNTPEVFKRIMDKGRGTINLSSKWEIDGRTIRFYDFHFYMEITKAKNEIDALELPEISRIIDNTVDGNPALKIVCSKGEYVDYVLKRILRDTQVASTASANMVTIIDDQPKLVGVIEYLQEWVKFRTNVLQKFYGKVLNSLKYEKERLEILIDFTSNRERVKTFIDALYENKAKGVKLLKEWYPNINDKIRDSILNMSVSSLADRDTRRKQLETKVQEIAEVEDILVNTDKLIIRQLKQVKTKYDKPRATEIVDMDLTFKDFHDVNEEEEDTVVDVFVSIDDNFIKKYHEYSVPSDVHGVWCKSDDYISVMDSAGRLIRINLKDLDYDGRDGRGTFIPVLAGIQNDVEARVVTYDVMKPNVTKGYLYSDGFASVLSFDEWLNAKYITKLTTEGVSPYAEYILAEIDLQKEFTVVYTSDNRIGIFTNDFKHKHRTARTKVISLNKNKDEYITHGVSVDIEDLQAIFPHDSMVTIPMNKLVKANTNVDFGVFNKLLCYTNED